MIGLKLKNSVWEKALLSLLGEKAEIWQENHPYSIILTDFKKEELVDFQNKVLVPLVGLNNDLKNKITLPCTKEELEFKLSKMSPHYENNYFIWDSLHRQLKNKHSKETLFLTEKEGHLIDYLIFCPNREATKEELLKNVWHYTKTTETHTIETTIYTLNQKLNKSAKNLLTYTQNGYKLV